MAVRSWGSPRVSASSSDPSGRWVRSAFWVGSPRPGSQERFADAINHELVPQLAGLPGVRRAVALWPVEREDDPPAIACQVIAEFDRRADLELMLASAERQALRAGVRDLLPLFHGTVSHIDYEIRSEP